MTTFRPPLQALPPSPRSRRSHKFAPLSDRLVADVRAKPSLVPAKSQGDDPIVLPQGRRGQKQLRGEAPALTSLHWYVPPSRPRKTRTSGCPVGSRAVVGHLQLAPAQFFVGSSEKSEHSAKTDSPSKALAGGGAFILLASDGLCRGGRAGACCF